MANLTENSNFDSVIQIETATLVLGGPAGPANAQAQALANRTKFLKDILDALPSETDRTLLELATLAEVIAGSDAVRAVTPATLSGRTATDTRTGLVELATDAEAQAGVDALRAVTPANLSARTATDVRTGLVELATDAEVQAGTDALRAVTPAGLSSRFATVTRSGIVELATDAETQSGLDGDRAVTPAGLRSDSDVAATANRVVRRDSSGGINVAGISASGNTTLGSGAGNSHTVNGLTNFVGTVSIGETTIEQNGRAIELAKNTASDTVTFIDFHARAGSDYDARILRNPGANGFLEIENTGIGRTRLKSNGTTIYEVDSVGNFSRVIPGGVQLYPDFACRAWVNFNGTNGAIRAAGNVSSVTRTAFAKYDANFSTPMPDPNFAGSGSAQKSDANDDANIIVNIGGNSGYTPVSTSARIRTFSSQVGNVESPYVYVSIHR